MECVPTVDMKEIRKVLECIGESANARTVFGETVVAEGRAVIPVARVSHGSGGYLDSGDGWAYEECDPECPPECEGGHSEGGGESSVWLAYSVNADPVGVIEVTAEGVRWIPTVDCNRLAVIAVTAGSIVAVVVAIGCLIKPR